MSTSASAPQEQELSRATLHQIAMPLTTPLSITEPEPASTQPPVLKELHALDLIEIRFLIAIFLNKSQLATCLLVNHTWFSWFLPVYWHTVWISPLQLARCHVEAVAKCGGLIRALHAGRIEDVSVFDQASVRNLVTLEVSSCLKSAGKQGSKFSTGDQASGVGNRTMVASDSFGQSALTLQDQQQQHHSQHHQQHQQQHRKNDGKSSEDQYHTMGCLRSILQRNATSLARFSWQSLGRDRTKDGYFRLLPGVMQGLEALESIHLTNWSLSRSDFVTILMACPRLKSLILEATSYMPDRQESSGQWASSCAVENVDIEDEKELHNVGLRKPTKSFVHEGVKSIKFIVIAVPVYLCHLPNLQHLSFHIGSPADNPFQILQQRQGLHENLCFPVADSDFGDALSTLPRRIQESCPKLCQLEWRAARALDPPTFLAMMRALDPKSLTVFEGHIPFAIMDEVLELILDRYADVLERLVLEGGGSKDGEKAPGNGSSMDRAELKFNVWRFLEECPRLRVLEIPYELVGSKEPVFSRDPFFVESANSSSSSAPSASSSTSSITFPKLSPTSTLHPPAFLLTPLSAVLSPTFTVNSDPPPTPTLPPQPMHPSHHSHRRGSWTITQPFEPDREWVCKDLERLWLRIKDMAGGFGGKDRCVEMLLPQVDEGARDSPGLFQDHSNYHQHHQHHHYHRIGKHGYSSARTTHSHSIKGQPWGSVPCSARLLLEKKILGRLSGLEKLRELNVGTGWYTLPDGKSG